MVDNSATDDALHQADTTEHKGLPFEATLDQEYRQSRTWPARIYNYLRKLFSMRFDNYVIIQVTPVVYALSLLAAAVGLGYLCVEAYFQSIWRGLFYTFIAAPLTFIVLAAALRALLEFYRVMFHIAEHMDSLVGIRDTVDALAGINENIKEIGDNIDELDGSIGKMIDSVDHMGNGLDEIVALTRRIPFWKNINRNSRRPQYREPDLFDD